MIRSMTAQGRAVLNTPMGNFSLEILSVNRKNLDMNISLPRELSFLEIPVRKWVGKRVKRGMVTIRMGLANSTISNILPSIQNLRGLRESLFKLQAELGCEEKVSFEFLLDQWDKYGKNPFSSEENSNEKIYEKLFDETLDNWIKMKEAEGALIQEDLLKRLSFIEKFVEKIEAIAPNRIEKQKERLEKRIEALDLEQTAEDQIRIAKEIVLFTDKIDTTEERVRLKAHLVQFKETLKSEEIAMGKRLDFLIQEMFREVNSLSVKCQELEVVQHALEIKGEIEKIREQVQNIE